VIFLKRNIKSFLIISLSITLVLILAGCKNSKNSEDELKQKVNAEISYIDNELLSMVNSLNNIYFDKYKVDEQKVPKKSANSEKEESSNKEGDESNSKGGSEKESGQQSSEDSSQKISSMKTNNLLKGDTEIDWDDLRNKVENLYDVWTTISVDLKDIGVNDENLSQFEHNMDNVAIAVKQENKQATLENAIQIYKQLAEFVKSYGSDDSILQTKYKLLVCYNYANQEQWELFQEALTDLKMSYSNFINKKTEYKGKETNIKNASMIINEINSTIDAKDKEIFFIKYKNLMQELNIISSI